MALNEYQFKPGSFKVTKSMKDDFSRDGFIIVRLVFQARVEARKISLQILQSRKRNLLSHDEVEKIKDTIVNGGMTDHSYKLADSVGSAPLMTLWKHPGNDTTGMLARCEKVVTTAEQLLGVQELYHYHGKVLLKPPYVGGQFEWHQDYGYWYKYCLRPDMMAMFLAVDECTQENGGLTLLRGSHNYGRVDHGFAGGQQGADMQRVKRLMEKCELVNADLNPGDALFFHSNVLHYSGHNKSKKRRIAINISYNDRYNEPVEPNMSPNYVKLNKVPDSAILECKTPNDFTGKEFVTASDDKLVKETAEQ